MQGSAWISQIVENVDDEETLLDTALSSVKETEDKMKKCKEERDSAIERANAADEALGVERSLKDQIQGKLDAKEADLTTKVKELATKEARIKELEEYSLNLTNRVARLELEKQEAEEAADLAQTHSFGLGYNEAVAEAKKQGWDYTKILLNPNVDPTIQDAPEQEMEAPVEGDAEEVQGSNS